MSCHKDSRHPERSLQFPPEIYIGLPTKYLYGRNSGPWTHCFNVEIHDANSGWFVYESEHDDGDPTMFDAHFIVDPQLRIVHFYNMIHVHNNDDYPIGHSTDTTLRCGIKQVKRAQFPHFFKSLNALFAFFLAQFFGPGWRFGVGFDERHSRNILQRGVAVAMRGGMETLLPASVVSHISESLVRWAVPVSMEKTLGMSKAYALWQNMHSEDNVGRKWHSIVYPEFPSPKRLQSPYAAPRIPM